MTSIRINRAGTEYRGFTHLNSTVYEEFGKMSEASVTLPREEVIDLDLREGIDELYLSHEYTDDWGELLDNGREATPYNRQDVWEGTGDVGFDETYNSTRVPFFREEYGTLRWVHGVKGAEWEIEVDFWHTEDTAQGSVDIGFHGSEGHIDNPQLFELGGGHVTFDFDNDEIEHTTTATSGTTTPYTFPGPGTPSDPYTALLEYRDGTLTVSLDGDEIFSEAPTPFYENRVTFAAYEPTQDQHFQFRNVRIVDDVFGGVIGEIDRTGPEAEIIADSFERRARQAEPTPSGYAIVGLTDDDAIEEQLDDVPEVEPAANRLLSTGTEIARQFSHKSPARVIRDISQRTDIEPIYHPNKRLSYTNNNQLNIGGFIGNPEFNRANAAFEGEVRIKQDNTGERYTHVRVIGAGEGEHQQVVTVVADDYNPGDPQRWNVLPKKDINRESELEKVGEVYMEQQAKDHFIVGATIKQYEVRIGDYYELSHDKLGLDDTILSAVYVKRIDDADGLRYTCEFSNRRRGRYDNRDEKDRLDITNYNKAAEGVVASLSKSSGRIPLTSSPTVESRTLYTGYPDDAFYDYTLTLTVRGLPDANGDYPNNMSVSHLRENDVNQVVAGGLGDGTTSFTEEVDVTGIPTADNPNFGVTTQFGNQGVVQLEIDGEVYRQLTTTG